MSKTDNKQKWGVTGNVKAVYVHMYDTNKPFFQILTGDGGTPRESTIYRKMLDTAVALRECLNNGTKNTRLLAIKDRQDPDKLFLATGLVLYVMHQNTKRAHTANAKIDRWYLIEAVANERYDLLCKVS